MNSTLDQTAPVSNPLEPSLSDTYDLYSGFWHIVTALKKPEASDRHSTNITIRFMTNAFSA